MKKIAIAIFAIGAIVLVAGCAKKAPVNNQDTANQESAQKEEKSGGIISSIKDAIGLGKKMQCTYVYKTGDQTFTTTAYIEGQKYKGESEIMGRKQSMVFDGETMYMWSETDKKGSKWTKSCMDELNKDNKQEEASAPAIGGEEAKDASEVFKNAMDVKCSDVASIDFSVPSDVAFSDMCEQMKKMQDLTKNLPQGIEIPAGIGEPSL